MNRQKSAAAYRAAAQKQNATRRRKAICLLCVIAIAFGVLGGYLLFAVLVISTARLTDPQGIYGIALSCAIAAAVYFSTVCLVFKGLLHGKIFSPACANGKKAAFSLTFLSLGVALLLALLTQIL